METDCSGQRLLFQAPGRREIVAAFDGGMISSDGGVLALGELEKRLGIVERLAGCFTDHRNPVFVEHSVEELVKQRVFGLALGYEDIDDHDTLRVDPLLAAAVGKRDVEGKHRVRESDRGKALAGKSTLSRLELSAESGSPNSRYKKLELDVGAVDELLVEVFLESYDEAPEELVLDIDATNDPIHGEQEGRFFQGYYDQYCYLPLYVFCEDHLLLARLRPGSVDAAQGALEELQRIVGHIHAAWPQTRIIIRGDAGFCRDGIMSWCERTPWRLDYVFGLAKNTRLEELSGDALFRAQCELDRTGRKARKFDGFRYRTRRSWSRSRRVVTKVELDQRGPNPRYVVTSLSRRSWTDRALYEDLYCARGDMENRIKEQQLGLFADRTSTHFLRSNQLRLYFSSFAYVLMSALRRLALTGTEFARAQCTTIRLKLLKIGAQVRVTVRKIWVSLSSAYPYVEQFHEIHRRLARLGPRVT
jgi:hypothetical protein